MAEGIGETGDGRPAAARGASAMLENAAHGGDRVPGRRDADAREVVPEPLAGTGEAPDAGRRAVRNALEVERGRQRGGGGGGEPGRAPGWRLADQRQPAAAGCFPEARRNDARWHAIRFQLIAPVAAFSAAAATRSCRCTGR